MEVNEPMVAYGAADDNSVYRFISAIRSGIPFAFFQKLSKDIPFSLSDWANLLHVSDRTLLRYKKDSKPLDSNSSEKILEITMLYKLGVEVFGNKEHFNTWLVTPSLALNNQTPKSLLDSSFGIQLVKTELHRIEHGVFA